jgi:hypothetical protein
MCVKSLHCKNALEGFNMAVTNVVNQYNCPSEDHNFFYVTSKLVVEDRTTGMRIGLIVYMRKSVLDYGKRKGKYAPIVKAILDCIASIHPCQAVYNPEYV